MMRTSTYEDLVRWARCLSEIMKQAGQLCQESARAGYVEVSSRLQVRLWGFVATQVADICATSRQVRYGHATKILLP